tara:strand:- start:503 stop:748 length:246 start_codon:yes stop_codon:yes gene_type:complete
MVGRHSIRGLGEFLKHLDMDKNKIKERLSDLRDEIYNAEDVIDGAYNSKDKNFKEYKEINVKYDALLKDMNKLVGLLNELV